MAAVMPRSTALPAASPPGGPAPITMTSNPSAISRLPWSKCVSRRRRSELPYPAGHRTVPTGPSAVTDRPCVTLCREAGTANRIDERRERDGHDGGGRTVLGRHRGLGPEAAARRGAGHLA